MTTKKASNKATATKEVAVVEEAGAVALAAYEDFDGAGFENQTAADMKVPFLSILQGLSPQCKGEDAEGRPGMLLDTASGTLYSGKTGVLIVPATTTRSFVEWRPRSAGGGFVAKHDPNSNVVANAEDKEVEGKRKKIAQSGNELVDTFYVTALLVEEDGTPSGWIIISCTSTKITPYRELMGRLRKHMIQLPNGKKVNPPLFANLIRVTTKEETRPSGSSFNYVFTPAINGNLNESLLLPSDPRFQAALECKRAVDGGLVSADMSKAERGTEEAEKDF